MTGNGQDRRKSLTDIVRDALSERVMADGLKPGDRLPTERELIDEFGVSRTVIRDAISRLRADGVVESRQGAGVFVRETIHWRSPPEAIETLSSIIETIEVRTAIEIEAARLAATRGSPAQIAEIGLRLEEMRAADSPEAAEAADLEFHRAVAAATNNRRFAEFFDFLGQRTIPRTQLRLLRQAPPPSPEYAARLIAEHEAIHEGIVGRDAVAAGRAMRLHMETSLSRYIRLIGGRAPQ